MEIEYQRDWSLVSVAIQYCDTKHCKTSPLIRKVVLHCSSFNAQYFLLISRTARRNYTLVALAGRWQQMRNLSASQPNPPEVPITLTIFIIITILGQKTLSPCPVVHHSHHSRPKKTFSLFSPLLDRHQTTPTSWSANQLFQSEILTAQLIVHS